MTTANTHHNEEARQLLEQLTGQAPTKEYLS